MMPGANAEIIRGILDRRVPPSLLIALEERLRRLGVDIRLHVYSHEAVVQELRLSDRNAFFGLLRSRTWNRIRFEVSGTAASDMCSEWAALIESGDPAVVLRAGFRKYDPAKALSDQSGVLHRDLARVGVPPRDLQGIVFVRIDQDNRPGGNLSNRVGGAMWLESKDIARLSVSDLEQGRVKVYASDESAWVALQKCLITSEYPIVEDRLKVMNKYGIHARTSYHLRTLARRFESVIMVEANGEQASAKSVMGLLTLQVERGTELTVRAQGPDAKEAIEALRVLIEVKRFNEDD